MVPLHELRMRRLEKYWQRRARVFSVRSIIEDRENFIQNVMEISKSILRALDKDDYALFKKIAEWLDLVLNGCANDLQNKIEKAIENTGLLTLYIFLNPSESESTLKKDLGELVRNISGMKIEDTIEVEALIENNWNRIFIKLCTLRERKMLNSRFEIDDENNNTTWEPSHFLCMMLIHAWEKNRELFNAVDKAKLQTDAVMLLVEEKNNDIKNSRILLFYGDNAESAYVKGKWVFPAIQVPVFSSDDVWQNSQKFCDMNKNIAQVISSFNSLPNITPILYLPSGQTGSFVIMLVELSGWSIQNIQKFFQTKANEKIPDGPFLYEKVELKTYDEVWNLAVGENKVYYRTLFFVACKLANTKSGQEEKLAILNTAKEIINRDLEENLFHILYLNNRGHSDLVDQLDDVFQKIEG